MKNRLWFPLVSILLACMLVFGAFGGAVAAPAIQAGDTVGLGYYEQGYAHTALDYTYWPLEWLVLEVDGDKALLLCKYALECMPFHDKSENVTWETSSLRSFLNDTFLYNALNAFGEGEMDALVPVTLSNPGGGSTEDKVFLLSREEVARYFPDEASRMAPATDVLLKDSTAAYSGQGNAFWWLRSPASEETSALLVNAAGGFEETEVTSDLICVRPAAWVKTSILSPAGLNPGSTLMALATESLATRNGPSTQYRETGTYKLKGENVPLVSIAYDQNGVGWVQCEVRSGNLLRRIYTGLKRFDPASFDLNLLPVEDPFGGTGEVLETTKALYGPGEEYDVYDKLTADKGKSVTIIALENGYAQVEWKTTKQQYRVWLPIEALWF